MSLRVNVRFSSPPADAGRLQAVLQAVPTPAEEAWVLTVAQCNGQAEWLVLAAGSVEKQAVPEEWCFVSVEDGPKRRVCTYARTLDGLERDPDSIAASVTRLMNARTLPAERRGP